MLLIFSHSFLFIKSILSFAIESGVAMSYFDSKSSASLD